MRQLDPEKLKALKTASQHFDETYGKRGTPEREIFHDESMAWYYGELLRDRRKALKMTQEELAKKINVPRTYISRIERGKSDIQMSSFLRVTSALGLQLLIQ